MSKVFDFSVTGGDGFCSGWSMHTNLEDSNLFFPLGSHVDVYFPRKRSRVSAPFVFIGEVKQQSSIEVLPDACLFEVFRRLSGGQERSACACVSKRWLMLLSSIHRDEIFPAKGNLGPEEHDNTSISEKADEVSKPKEKVEFVDFSVVKTVNKEEFEGNDSDGFLSRCLEGKKATDMRLASIAVGTGSRGGLGKLFIHGNSSTRGLTNLGLRAIGRGCPSLRSLSLWNLSSIGDEGLLEIASGARLLEKLDLCHCPAITDKGLIAIAMNCLNLMSVTIESCTNIGNESLKALGHYCPNLKCITVKNCALVSDQGIASLFSSAGHVLSKAKFQALGISDVSLAVIGHYGSAMTDLALLDLQSVNDRGFWVMGKGQGLQKLKVLSITACRGISDSGLQALGDGCPNLKLFGLRKSLVSDTGMAKFARAAVTLESLQLEECHRITQCGVFHILANCGGKLKALALENCLGVGDINFVFPSTSICHPLQSLIIHNCPGFGNAGLAILGRMCPKLTQVQLSGLQGITDTGLLPLVHSLEAGLIKLNLSGSVNLTDNSVVAITKLHGETLKLMNLDGCKYLTDVTLSEIAWNCSVLSELDVSMCGITDSGIASLAGAEKLSLQMFSLAGCSFVSDKSLPFLGVLGKTLVGLNIQHCNGISSSSIDLLLEQLWRCDVLY